MDRPATDAPAGRVLCRLADIPDGTGKGFDLGGGDEPLEIFVVRDGSQVYAYRNVCPHTGSPLDWQPDDFMNEDGSLIMCHTHGALFEIADGFCVAGPCAGDQLTPVAVEVDQAGDVVLGETLTADA
jgi:nitrite reductase/ring-hydroxylating ferredoxin subunit